MSHPRSVPMVDLRALHAPLRAEIDEAVARVLDSQRFIGGPEVEAFEAALAELCGTEHAVACGSGSDALMLALEAAGIGPGDDVLCPAFTFFATAGEVARTGARPVFVDVDPATLNVGPEQAEAGLAHCERPRALLAVDLFGRAAPMGPLLDWAARHDLLLIEDAAQAIGARDGDGAASGSRGLVGTFSFFPSKNLGALGDGGALTTRSASLAQRIRLLRDHGRGPDGRHGVAGTNSRLDALQAAILRVKLRYLDGWTKRLQEHADFYDRRFAELGGVGGVGAAIAPPPPAAAPAVHVYNQYVVRVDASLRDPLRAHLAERGIETRIYYERSLQREPCFESSPSAPLPATEAACAETLALPNHPDLSPADRSYVAESVLAFLAAR